MSVKRISIGSGTTVCYADDGQAVAYEDYAALETLCREQHEALEFINKRCAIYGPADAARAKIMAVSDKFAALFPKTGGAK